jgi:hypothetical protein
MALCPIGTIVNFLPVLIYRFVILTKIAVAWLSLGHKMRSQIFRHQRSAESKI